MVVLHSITDGGILYNSYNSSLTYSYNLIINNPFIYLQSFITRDGPERRVLSVHIISTQTNEVDNETETDEAEITNMERHEKITDLETFKSSKELYPICLPVLDIKAKGARSKL